MKEIKVRVKSDGRVINVEPVYVEHKKKKNNVELVLSHYIEIIGENKYIYLPNMIEPIEPNWMEKFMEFANTAMSAIIANPNTALQIISDKRYAEIGNTEKVVALASMMYAEEMVNKLKEMYKNE